MAVYVTSFDTDGAVGATFDYLADFSNAADWDPGVANVTRLDTGKPRIGSRFDVEVSTLGTRQILRYEITRLERPFLITFEARTRILHSRDEIKLVPTSDGTHLTYNARLSLSPALRLADPALQLLFESIGSRARDGLAAALDIQVPALARHWPQAAVG